jgi:hypothetical protein
MISKQITLADCVARAKMQLGLASTTDNDIWFEVLADEAAKHLNCLSIYVKKQCNIEIENGKAKLPCGFGRLVGMRFCDTDSGNFLEGIYADMKFLTLDCSCTGEELNGYLPYNSLFEIIDDYIHFHTEPASDNATLAYIGLNVDDNGMLIIYEKYERAIWNYICSMYADQNPEKVPSRTAMKYHEVWKSQKAWLKGEDVKDNYIDTKRQVREWSKALVADKNWTL